MLVSFTARLLARRIPAALCLLFPVTHWSVAMCNGTPQSNRCASIVINRIER